MKHPDESIMKFFFLVVAGYVFICVATAGFWIYGLCNNFFMDKDTSDEEMKD